MSDYRRYYVPGGTYFFTLVSHERRPIFVNDMARTILREAMKSINEKWEFETVAIVLLPEHLHAIWTLPRGDDRYSIRWKRIKEEFTRRFLDHGGVEGKRSNSRRAKGERGVWQRRFWEHTIDDEEDLERCIDYVHWNPRKHKLVPRVADWPHSSFHRYVAHGAYNLEWGGTDPCPNYDTPEWE
jgi:putative transposase